MKKKSVEIDMEYCAVNVYGFAYGNTMFEALDLLGQEYDGKKGYTEEKATRSLLRVFKFPKGHRPIWMTYCPVWKDESANGLPWWLIEDNMKEWKSGDLPIKQKIKAVKRLKLFK